jgi:hypothetical protein
MLLKRLETLLKTLLNGLKTFHNLRKINRIYMFEMGLYRHKKTQIKRDEFLVYPEAFAE